MDTRGQSLRIRITVTLGAMRRAFAEFLGVPTLVIIGFLLLAVLTYWLDRVAWEWLDPVREFLHMYVFADIQGTNQLLRTIAGGLMTVTSVTISIMLLALQQSAAAMTTSVFDQFLRRRINQFYFGFFVGLAAYALITLATVNAPFNPVIGGAVAFVLTVIALFLLIVLLYTTINQIRPMEIIDTIHDHTLAARTRQLELLARTRRQALYTGAVQRSLRTGRRGMITAVALEEIAAAIVETEGLVEVEIKAPIGTYVNFGQELAVIDAATEETADRVEEAVHDAFEIERQRDITSDPDYGIEQLETIAWSSISSAKSDIAPGLLTIYSLRDLLARWCEEAEQEQEFKERREPVPVVYPDTTLMHSLQALESLAVVSSESMQPQIYAAVIETFARLFKRLPAEEQAYAESIILRLLSALGDHVLTSELELRLLQLVEALTAADRHETADAVAGALSELRRSVGVLRSRTTRAAYSIGDAPAAPPVLAHKGGNEDEQT